MTYVYMQVNFIHVNAISKQRSYCTYDYIMRPYTKADMVAAGVEACPLITKTLP